MNGLKQPIYFWVVRLNDRTKGRMPKALWGVR
jgi:hypothetical protein